MLVQKDLQNSPFSSGLTPALLQNQTHYRRTLVLHANPQGLGLILF